ncbi:MAG: hypothetical protein SFY70_02215 [Bacteroidia bacterium]|nr:hypothetical protein [Bacteroidia bacterium]
MMNFIQGESWTQDLKLLVDGQPLKAGPLEWAEQHLDWAEMLIKVNTRVQARYFWPWTEEKDKHDVLEIDLFDENVLRFKVSKKQSRFFEPGYLTCFTTLKYRDASKGDNGIVEVVQIIGYLLKTDVALRL